MGITQTTPMSEIDAHIEQQIERTVDDIIYNLQYVGERVINHARNLPSIKPEGMKRRQIPPHQPNYIDWSANLRSSIGYVISMDGKIVYQSDFAVIKNGDSGAKSGIQYAKEIVRQFPEGFALIVVAGMEYASYVTAKGYDVLDSAELLAGKLASNLEAKFKSKKS